MKVSIIMSEPSRSDAQRAMVTSGQHCNGFDVNNPRAFRGPVFENASCVFEKRLVRVHCDSGELYVYPYHTVNRVKVEQD